MIEELQHRLDYVLSERERLCGIAKANLAGDLIKRGMSSGSGAMLAKEALAREQLDGVVPMLLADVERARQGGVPEADLRAALDRAVDVVMASLRGHFIEKPNPAFGGSAYGARPELLDELEARARSQVRQYWAGYLTPNAPPGSYTLSVSGSPGAAVQVGGTGNVQAVTNTTINLAAAQAAAAQLGEALAALPVSSERAEAEADLAGLQHHLARKEPQPSLIKALGRSLRATIAKGLEGFASGGGEEAAEHLWDALDV